MSDNEHIFLLELYFLRILLVWNRNVLFSLPHFCSIDYVSLTERMMLNILHKLHF